jgi:hypothetical protein
MPPGITIGEHQVDRMTGFGELQPGLGGVRRDPYLEAFGVQGSGDQDPHHPVVVHDQNARHATAFRRNGPRSNPIRSRDLHIAWSYRPVG